VRAPVTWEAMDTHRGDLPPVEAVLLDLYDTLAWIPRHVVDREPIVRATGIEPDQLRAAWMETYDERATGALPSLEDEIDAILRACGVSATPELLARLAAEEYEVWVEGVRVYEDSMDSISSLRERRIRTAIVSNCSRQTKDVVPACGFDRAVDTVVLSFEAGVRKPDARIYEIALERLGVRPERALFVDDIAEYLDGARALGIRTAQIVREGVERDPGDGHPRISTLGELEPLLTG
jgi:putative hydrolase of the HAD superfamily